MDYKKLWEEMRRTLEDTEVLPVNESCIVLQLMNKIESKTRR